MPRRPALVGPQSLRPDPASQWRLYFNEDTNGWQISNGSTWSDLGGGGMSVHANEYHTPDMALATHDHSGVYEPAASAIQTHITGTGSPHTAAGVGAEAAGAVSTHNGLTAPHASATSIGGKAIPGAGFEPAGTAAGEVLAHSGAADPHTGYQKESERATANGYASLDAGTKVPIAQVPTGVTSTTVCIGNDSRLSDARTPTTHSIAGAEHSADTLANLNAKISDADVPAAVGFAKITVGSSAPGTPGTGDLWIDTT